MNKRVLYTATVVKTHIMHFHIPYLKMFKELGWHTTVAARNDYVDPSKCNIPYCDDYHNIAFERSPLKLANIKVYHELKKIINEGKFDIVHCHTPVAAMLTRLAAIKARKRGTKVIYTAHGFHFFKGAPLINWLLYFPVEWICSFLTDTLITINKEDYARALRFKARETHYIPGVGIDTKKFAPDEIIRSKVRQKFGFKDNEIILLSVGEVNKNKNHKVVIKALARLERKDIKYVICGSGPQMDALIQLAESLGIKEHIILTGYRNDVADIYQAADIFIFPSFREGLGLAAIEAMAAGLPIITSNIHGINDYSVDNQTGFKCDPNDVQGFADAIEKLAEDEELRLNMSMNVRGKVEKYDINHAVAAMKRIYDLQ